MAAYALALPFNIFAALFILFCLVFFTVPITITIDLFGYLCCLPLLAIGNSCGKNCFDFVSGPQSVNLIGNNLIRGTANSGAGVERISPLME